MLSIYMIIDPNLYIFLICRRRNILISMLILLLLLLEGTNLIGITILHLSCIEITFFECFWTIKAFLHFFVIFYCLPFSWMYLEKIDYNVGEFCPFARQLRRLDNRDSHITVCNKLNKWFPWCLKRLSQSKCFPK